MSGYLYKYTNSAGEVVYVGQSKTQHSLINRLYSHDEHDRRWAADCIVEFAEIPLETDLTTAETAAINYYYKKGISENISQVGAMSLKESQAFLRRLSLTWIPIDINKILPTNEAPHLGGIVVDLSKGRLMGAYIITQIIHTNNGIVYRLFRTDFAACDREEVTFAQLMEYGNLHYYNHALFEKLANKYHWDEVA